MKSVVFKKMIKEAVREAIQDELKDLLLEALRSSKSSPVATPINEQYVPNVPVPPQPTAQSTTEQRRAMYEEALGNTALSFTSRDVQKFNPSPNIDPVNGSLPSGEVGMDQIMSLMNPK